MKRIIPTVANDVGPIQPMPEVGLHGGAIIIMATLDGNVTFRTPGGDVKLDPDSAIKAAKMMQESARVARHIRMLTNMAPKGLDEQGMIDFITKAFSETPMPMALPHEEINDGRS